MTTAPTSLSTSPANTDEHSTFGDFVDTYKTYRSTMDLAPETIETEWYALRDRILPAIEDWSLQDVTLKDFQDLRLRWHEVYVEPEKLSPATVNKWIRILKHFVGWTARREGVQHPCRDLEFLAEPKEKRGRAMTRAELSRLLDAVEDRYPHYFAICYLAAYTGQRYGTLARVKWEDIDVENGVIRFEHSKTGHRTSAPLDRFRDVLKAHRETLSEWSPVAFEKSEYVFPCKGDPDDLKGGGLRKDTSSLNKALKRCCKGIGIEKITFHDFRRTFVSLALEAGVAPDLVRSFTGHSEQMLGHYHHQSKSSRNDVIGVVMGDPDVGDEGSEPAATAAEMRL